jgi:hypothetical protein
LSKFATVFQTERYAILKCACENIRRAYKNKRFLIFSDSQPAFKALSSPKVTSELVAECLNALSVLVSLNEVTLSSGCLGTITFLAMRKLTGLLDKHQPCRYLVLSWLLEYLNVQQGKQLGPELRMNIIILEEICQTIEMASFL